LVGFQVVAEQELAKRVAVQAAAQAAENATNDQKERASKELHDTPIAQEADQSALPSFSANQSGNQQGVSIPGYQSGFIPYSSAVHYATVQPQSQQGNLLKNTCSLFISASGFCCATGALLRVLTSRSWF